MFRLFITQILIAITLSADAQSLTADMVKMQYDKHECFVPMRDGTKLYTIVYTPKDTSEQYPFLINRTCYSASRYDNYNVMIQPSEFLVKEGYILVYQDVRGRYMSEGKFDNMRPNIPGNIPENKKDVDESSDTYDTIEWLLQNIDNNNGKAGMFGISYPGFYTAAAIPDAHPALKASSPQAPIADFYFDDFHHHGAFLQSYIPAFAVFGYQKDTLTRDPWYMEEINRIMSQEVPDAYSYYLEKGPLKHITEELHHDNFFWNQIIEHPDYDTFWQKRNLLPHLEEVNHAVMTVGGWFDAEDLYGPLNIYKTIEKNNPQNQNTIVMGPWTHGDWARNNGEQIINHIKFGDSISYYYQKDIEAPFFRYHLKGKGNPDIAEAIMFDTGRKEWRQFSVWPPEEIPPVEFYFEENGQLLVNSKSSEMLSFDYISDPAHPVPYRSEVSGLTFTPRQFITDDQRHASRRPDVLSFSTDILDADITIAGEILANLIVSLNVGDADFVVKLIDVYPDDHPDYAHNPDNIEMGGYQQLVRHEVFRGRYRNGYDQPQAFTPGKAELVSMPLQDILHTFKKGHRIMIQIHSSWFPYIDRNPQKYVDNIYKADEEDFIKAKITVHGSSHILAGGKIRNIVKAKP